VIRLRRSQNVAGLTTGRITAFSDGVFSIAITLLVLNLQIPKGITSLTDLLNKLQALWPNLMSYVLSFVIIGIYWVAHHNMFHYIKRSDRMFLWINILLLMCVAFIPFPAGLLGQFSFVSQSSLAKVAEIIYACNLILTNLTLSLLWWYATSHHRLVDQDIDPHFVNIVNRRNMTAPVVYAASIGLSFLNVYLSLIVFFLFPLYYIIPSHVDLHLTPTSRSQEEAGEHDASTGEGNSVAEGQGEEAIS
jgi:uncharacterized membrane protein